MQVADQFIVIKCEGHLPAADVKLADVRGALLEEIRERKSRAASSELFRGLQDASTVENVMNDSDKSVTRPGVAALVNGEAVELERVRETCLDRHGADVLEILITRVLLKQALDRSQQQVTQADLDSEVTRAALAMGFRKPDGSADTSAWLERVTRDQKVPLRHYVEDIVQPTVALKKLVGKVPVTNEDLDKAFDATFGPRSRCRVIVLDNQRRAQEVWQMARENPTAERMGDLAEKYSVDPTSRTLRGEVPPIQRFGGQPALEREAFALKPGELSGIVQIADRFMVLFCEGYTEPMAVQFAEVRDELYEDILDKKQRIEMARSFSHLREGAAIDNFLAGTSQTAAVGPERPAPPWAGRFSRGPAPSSWPTAPNPAPRRPKPRWGAGSRRQQRRRSSERATRLGSPLCSRRRRCQSSSSSGSARGKNKPPQAPTRPQRDGQRNHPCANRSGRTAARASGDLGVVHRVIGWPIGRVLGRRAHGELVHVGRADDDGTGRFEAAHDRGVVRGPPPVEDLASA